MVCKYFDNPPISLKSQHETETETQVETQTRKQAHDPLVKIGGNHLPQELSKMSVSRQFCTHKFSMQSPTYFPLDHGLCKKILLDLTPCLKLQSKVYSNESSVTRKKQITIHLDRRTVGRTDTNIQTMLRVENRYVLRHKWITTWSHGGQTDWPSLSLGIKSPMPLSPGKQKCMMGKICGLYSTGST